MYQLRAAEVKRIKIFTRKNIKTMTATIWLFHILPGFGTFIHTQPLGSPSTFLFLLFVGPRRTHSQSMMHLFLLSEENIKHGEANTGPIGVLGA